MRHCRKSQDWFQQALAGARRVWAENEDSRKQAKFTHSTDTDSVGELRQSMMGDNSRNLIVSQLFDLLRNSLADAKSQLPETELQSDPDPAAFQSMMGDSSRDLIVSQVVDLLRNSLADARSQVPETQPQPCPDPATIPSAGIEDEDTSQPIAQR